MTRVCLIGNSHFASIKKGWDRLPDLAQEMELVFFGSQGIMLEDLKVGEGYLYGGSDEINRYIAVTSGGLKRIEAADYDAFVVVGLELTFAFAADLYLTHRLMDHQERGTSLISRGALEGSLLAFLRSTLAARTVAKLRRITPAPIMLIPNPLPNPTIRQNVRYRKRWTHEHMTFLLDLYRAQFEILGKELDVITYTQPAHTVEAPCFTRASYAFNPEADHYHTNEAFGIELLREITPALRSLALRASG